MARMNPHIKPELVDAPSREVWVKYLEAEVQHAETRGDQLRRKQIVHLISLGSPPEKVDLSEHPRLRDFIAEGASCG
jgi:hypothetical protein